MRTEYGFRRTDGSERWVTWSYDATANYCKQFGHTLIAREVSETRVVSVR